MITTRHSEKFVIFNIGMRAQFATSLKNFKCTYVVYFEGRFHYDLMVSPEKD